MIDGAVSDRADAPVLVLGGTGKTGRRIVEGLRAKGIPVRVGSRTAPIPFDWDAPDGWAAALDGVRAVYISYYPDLAVPGARDAVTRLIGMALARGIHRLVLLSGRGEDEAQDAERVLMNSGADWTILRAAWFCQNFSESFLMDGVLSGTLVLPASGDIGEPFVDADDIADVAVAALSTPGHIGQLYELTGPRLMTFHDVAADLSAATGRTVLFQPIEAQAYRTLLGKQGVPDDFAGLVLYLMTTVLDGRNAYLADGVQRALGRAPRDFSTYAATVAQSGVWEREDA